MNIFLDDERAPSQVTWIGGGFTEVEQWVIAASPEVFKNVVTASLGKIDKISFDNDLGVDTEGYHLLKWMIQLYLVNNMEQNLPKVFYIHTKNPIARTNMIEYLKGFRVYFDLSFDIV